MTGLNAAGVYELQLEPQDPIVMKTVERLICQLK